MSTRLTKRVLILEDSTTQSRIIAKMFGKLDFAVTAVADQSAFVKRLCEENWDLLVIDVFIEGENSLEHLNEFRALKPDVPIAVMTAGRDTLMDGASAALNRARRAHVDFLLPKPFDLIDIQQIRRELDTAAAKRTIRVEDDTVYLD
jgi:CheY-like chemotaxis protein